MLSQLLFWMLCNPWDASESVGRSRNKERIWVTVPVCLLGLHLLASWTKICGFPRLTRAIGEDPWAPSCSLFVVSAGKGREHLPTLGIVSLMLSFVSSTWLCRSQVQVPVQVPGSVHWYVCANERGDLLSLEVHFLHRTCQENSNQDSKALRVW